MSLERPWASATLTLKFRLFFTVKQSSRMLSAARSGVDALRCAVLPSVVRAREENRGICCGIHKTLNPLDLGTLLCRRTHESIEKEADRSGTTVVCVGAQEDASRSYDM